MLSVYLSNIIKNFIPNLYYPKLINIKNIIFDKFKKEYYSQFGEDVVINKLLNKKNGFYLDVGAYHPKHLSNTYLLYKKGWQGINVDPNPYSITLFNKYRKKDINLQIGISTKETVETLFMFSHSNWNTFSKEKAEEWKKKEGIRYLGKLEVHCLPLREVIKKYVPRKYKVDFLNVDAEGLDLEVVKSNDWHSNRPKVICVECSNFDTSFPDKSEIYVFLKNNGYVLYAFMGLSLIFLRNE